MVIPSEQPEPGWTVSVPEDPEGYPSAFRGFGSLCGASTAVSDDPEPLSLFDVEAPFRSTEVVRVTRGLL